MKPPFLRLLLMLTALALLPDSPARGETIDFSDHWSVVPTVITGAKGNTGSLAIVPPPFPPDGTGSVIRGDPVGTMITGPTVTTVSNAKTTLPDSYSTPYTVDLHLTDAASGLSGDLLFKGTIAGTVTSTTSQLTSTFTNPMQQLSLGTHVYTVSLEQFLGTPFLPAPGVSNVTINAQVTATGPITDPVGTPEPSGLVLGATAMLGLAVRRLARARANRLIA